MKENSIEEDMKIVEQIKDIFLYLKFHGWINDIKQDIDTDKAIRTLEHILSDYKRVLKENEELIKENSMIKKVDKIVENITITDIENAIEEAEQHYISVQKVKDKIEESKKNLYTVEHYETVGAINVLQELLEGRK